MMQHGGYQQHQGMGQQYPRREQQEYPRHLLPVNAPTRAPSGMFPRTGAAPIPQTATPPISPDRARGVTEEQTDQSGSTAAQQLSARARGKRKLSTSGSPDGDRRGPYTPSTPPENTPAWPASASRAVLGSPISRRQPATSTSPAVPRGAVSQQQPVASTSRVAPPGYVSQQETVARASDSGPTGYRHRLPAPGRVANSISGSVYFPRMSDPPHPGTLQCPDIEFAATRAYHVVWYGPEVGIFAEWYVELESSCRCIDHACRGDIQRDIEGFPSKGHNKKTGWANAVAEYARMYNKGDVQAFDRGG